jgi:hypothetical protein
MRSRRGFSSFAALSAVTAIGVLLAIAISARTTELGFEGRSLCRVRARWAAESAIARGRAGSSNLNARLDAVTTYQLRIHREGGALRLLGTGVCTAEHRSSSVTIDALLSGDRIVEWHERSP